ncbi:UvrB/UvrC motif-containing protein [Candidatus Gottesmanbacteria bacterium]|nr:UvrB/UvrC motif-containing protein [Candidatus Gottesmanbacteria bacterium]
MKLSGEKKRAAMHQYRRNIFRLRGILAGKSTRIIKEMEKEMGEKAVHNEFEKAAILRNQLQRLSEILERHYDPALYMAGEGVGDIFAKEERTLVSALSSVYVHLSRLNRIECVDISNLGGKQAVGSLVVLTDGQPDKSQYRKFRIRMPNRPNDVAMIAEVLHRRLNHQEWPYPDLLVIDGGKGQVGSVLNVLREQHLPIPVIGLAKQREEIIAPKDGTFVTIRLPLTSPGLHLLERIRDEAHRFAISYHRILRRKSSLLFRE